MDVPLRPENPELVRREERADRDGTAVEVTAEAPAIAQAELALHESREARLRTELDILGRQAEQRQQELEELQSKLARLGGSYDLAAQELQLMQSIGGAQRVVPKGDLLRLQRQVNDLKGDLDQTRLSVPRAQSALS